MPTLSDLFAVYDLAGTVYFRVDSSGNLYGAGGDILGGSDVDFGSTSAEGGNVYLADSKVLGCGSAQELQITSDGADSSITHAAANDGEDFTIALTGAKNASVFLNSSGTGADAIAITASAGGIDITSAAGLDLVSAGTTSGWTHTADGAADDLTIAVAGAQDSSLILQSAGTGADALKITASAGGIVMASANTTASWTHTANGAADDLTISVAGAQDASLVLASAGTGADAMSLTASAGGIDITAATGLDLVSAGTTSGWTHTADGAADDLTIAVAGAQDSSLILSSAGTAADALQITASAGGIDISSAAQLDLVSAAEACGWTHTADGAGDDLTIAVAGATDSSLVLQSAGTGADAIHLNATAGTVKLTGSAFDVNTSIDQDHTLTAAGTVLAQDVVVEAATGNAYGLAVSMVQTTNNRTAGACYGISSTVRSLSSDTAGVDYIAYYANATVGEAGADHYGLYFDDGFDAIVNTTACADGNANWLLKANVADALTIEDSAGEYATFVSSTGSQAINLKQRVTTTDGVSSGTARVVGGRAYSNTAASSAVTNTKAETLFDTNYEIPANTLKAGTQVRISWQGIATATNGTDTLAIKLYIGGLTGTALTTLAATDVANDDVYSGEMVLVVRTVGTGGTFVAHGWSSDFTSASSEAVVREFVAETAIDTTAAQTVGVSAEWNAASTANSCRLDVLTVDIL